VTVTQGTVVREQAALGTVIPAGIVDLAFERSGRVIRVAANVGETVQSGKVLVQLDSTELDAKLTETLAKLDSVRSSLALLAQGPSTATVQKKKVEFEKAEANLVSAYSAIAGTIWSAYAKADDAVRAKTDRLFLNDESDVPLFTFAVGDSRVEADARGGRVAARDALIAWQQSLVGVSATSSSSTLVQATAGARNYLNTVRGFLEHASDVLRASVGMTPSTLGSYTAAIDAARTNVNAAIAAVDSKAQTVTVRTVTMGRIADELAAMLDGTVDHGAISTQEARVAELEARAERYRTQIAGLSLRSPIAGVVVANNAVRGELVASKKAIVQVSPGSDFQVEVVLPAVAGEEVTVGSPASVRFGDDASQVVEATVVEVDENTTDAVDLRRVILQLAPYEQSIEAGKQVAATIRLGERQNVLVLPSAAISESESGATVVRRDPDGVERTVTVEVGLRGSNGTIEIVRGLALGDVVIVARGDPRE
jgi:multidrug efflux pump subunit AcrA (membrane-fusion protein)